MVHVMETDLKSRPGGKGGESESEPEQSVMSMEYGVRGMGENLVQEDNDVHLVS